jgi:ankyrin repeat protein
MKKLLLLITFCAMLNGMENPKREHGHYVGMEDLSPEIKVMIIQSLHTYDFPDDVIDAIKALSLTDKELNAIVNDMYGNQQGFAQLAHLLANKFGETTESIAKKFKTPAANHYLNLAKQVHNAISHADFNTALQLVKKGADVNFPAQLLITILTTHTTLDDTINALKTASITNEQLDKMINIDYGDLKGLTTLIQALSVLFKEPTMRIAQNLDTEAADTYIELGNALIRALSYSFSYSQIEVIKLINKGADIHFTNAHYQTPLKQAILKSNIEGVKLLLAAGVEPTLIDLLLASQVKVLHPQKEEALIIENILKTAMQEK